jgi:hypothetical protein
VNPNATVVFNKVELAKAIHEEADAGPGRGDLSARVSWVIFGINVSGSPGLPNSVINKRILAKRFSLELNN